jgi:hypothetical protein
MMESIVQLPARDFEDLVTETAARMGVHPASAASPARIGDCPMFRPACELAARASGRRLAAPLWVSGLP